MPIVLIVTIALWALANLVFAFVEPPPALARFMPTKIWVIFSILPPPWDRRAGMLFNGVGGLLLALYFFKYVEF